TDTAPVPPPSAGVSGPPLPAVPGYDILEKLGSGTFGVVYKARHHSLKRIVALKMVREGAHAPPEELGRFRTEAESVARLQHPNIVQIHEIGQPAGLPYMALEYVAGGSLAQQLNGTPLPSRTAAELVQTLARAMHAAHENLIVHRDLKPGNILLDCRLPIADNQLRPGPDAPTAPATGPLTPAPPSPRGREAKKGPRRPPGKTGQAAIGNPKITDFGLAKLLDKTSGRTRTGAIMGTPSYMAPEQASGNTGAVGPAADTYALGAILYE